MPTPPPVPNCLEVKIHWGTAAVEYGQNVLHFINSGAVVVNQGLADTLDTAIKGIFSTSGLAVNIVAGFGLRQVGVRNLALANQAEFLGSGAYSNGSATGDALPTGIAQCYTFRTAMAGKSFRGRAYLSLWGEALSAASNQDATAAATGTTFFTNIRTSLATSPNIQQCIVSRVSAGAQRPTPITTPVTACQLRSVIWNTQRRRMAPGGAGVVTLASMQQLETVDHTFYAQPPTP